MTYIKALAFYVYRSCVLPYMICFYKLLLSMEKLKILLLFSSYVGDPRAHHKEVEARIKVVEECKSN